MDDRGLWLVVTGTGRCGTKFTNKVLGSISLKCMHQGVFRPGRGGPGSPEVDPGLVELVTVADVKQRVATQKAGRWGWVAETSWLAAPYLGIEEMEGITVVHLVRHPKKVIDSLVKCQVFEVRERYGLYYDFAYHWVPQMRYLKTPEERAAEFYVKWNNIIEPYADVFWRVEDGPEGLLDKLGLDYEGYELFNNTRYNTRGGTPGDVQPEKLHPMLADELLSMTERYGYEWPGV